MFLVCSLVVLVCVQYCPNEEHGSSCVGQTARRCHRESVQETNERGQEGEAVSICSFWRGVCLYRRVSLLYDATKSSPEEEEEEEM